LQERLFLLVLFDAGSVSPVPGMHQEAPVIRYQ
jgi:hypothetical protein